MPKIRKIVNKDDVKVNGSSVNSIHEYQSLEKTKVPLRITSNMVILVSPENQNPEYAQQYLERYLNRAL